MPDTEAQLKAAIYLNVAKMIEKQTSQLGVTASPSFVASLVELVYNQVVTLGEDLELFADHAGRTAINTSDVYMVTRKNDVLTKALQDYERSLTK